jgi:hypothetical protein
MGIGIQQGLGIEDNARRTETTLNGTLFDKSLL